MNLEQLIGQKLLFAFHGKETLSPEIIQAFKNYQPSGITLFRHLNIDSPNQVRALNEALQSQAQALNLPALLIAADQEGGQLMAIGDGTPLPGNMALGAARSTELAREAGEVLGREMRALGVNVNYAPCADVNINPQNPVVGVRSFGENQNLVAELTAAMIEGIQSQGVAATVKHFPGHGDTASDSHHGFGTVAHSLERFHAVELVPFRAAIQADAKMMMTAHLGVTSIDGPDAPPATLSKKILTDLLRDELKYQGVVITDALDMRAIRQGELLREDALRSAQSGADLLLVTSDPEDQKRVYESLLQGAQNGNLPSAELQKSVSRILRLKEWLAQFPNTPDLSVIQSAAHLQVANKIAERSITLVRDQAKLLPLKLEAQKKIAVIIPKPLDLTPADTSSYITPKLADSIRQYHANVDEFIIPFAPSENEIANLLLQLEKYDLLIFGTINAYAERKQADLINQSLRLNIPLIVVAMRLPYDLAAVPHVSTYLCTYSILEPSMQAAAKALFGHNPMTGQLPVSIPGMVEAKF
ncbi:MAG: glycoside hydrolase family 3 protein [Anaerolineales bacterium]|nr:glycoside hydrolase family 3 protein [Anaerolineales bacterium]